MKCEACGKKMKKGETTCPDCGKETPKEEMKEAVEKAEAAETAIDEKAEKPKKKLKTILIIAGGCIAAAALVYVFLVVLPDTGNDFWTKAPECTAISTELEAGVPCDPMELIEITDDRDREWAYEIEDNDIDISELGTYTVTYLFTSNKTEREVAMEFEVVEGELPQIEQTADEVRYGTTLEETEWFEVTNIKDFEYSVDDSECNYDVIGKYPVYINLYNSREVDERYEYEIEVVDTRCPTMNCPSEIKIVKGEEIDLLVGVSAEDNYDGDVTDQVKYQGNIDRDVPGEYQVTYYVFDSSGNKAEKTVDVDVMAKKGDEVNINNWTVVVDKYYFTNRINDKGYHGYIYFYYDAFAGTTFLTVNLRTTNNGEEDDCLADEMMSGFLADEEIYLHFGDTNTIEQKTYELRNDITNSDQQYYVSPGKQKSGKLYFHVIDAMKEFEGDIILEIKSVKGNTSGESVYIVLN